MNVKTIAAACLIAATAAMAHADEEEEHFDIFVGRPAAGSGGTQTLVGGALVPEDLNLEERIFEGDLGTLEIAGNNFYTTEEPGFFNAGPDSPGLLGATNPAGADPLNAGETPSLTQTAPLAYWDGTGKVVFGPTSAELFINPFTSSAAANGSMDSHPIFDIDDLGTTALPAGGIYLATMTVQLTGLDASDEVLVLFVTGEEFEGGVERAEFVLGAIPEPASLCLALPLLAGVVTRRKRG